MTIGFMVFLATVNIINLVAPDLWQTTHLLLLSLSQIIIVLHRVVSHFGGAENLILVVEDKLPEPRANEVRVKIHYIKLFSYPRYIMKAATILSCILLIIKNQSKDNGSVNLCWDKIVDTLTNTCSFRIK